LFPRQEPDAPSTWPTGDSSSGWPKADPNVDPESLSYCERKYAGLTSGPIPDLGPQSLTAIWALIGVATVFVALRFYCKIWKNKKLWWDDFFMALAWVRFLFPPL
jgi:hypothetical protein